MTFNIKIESDTKDNIALIRVIVFDIGNLKLVTNELEYNNIKDFYKEESSGFGVETFVGQGTDKETSSKHPLGSTTISMENQGYEKEGITHATIGKGIIEVGGEEKTDLASKWKIFNKSY